MARALFGRYELERRLAVGGMGELLLARLPGPATFSKRVVIKRIHPHLQSDPSAAKMFADEARVMAMLSHPNLVQVFELSEIEGQLCLVMEYLEGTDLQALIDHCRLDQVPIQASVAAYCVSRVAAALHYVHEFRDEAGSPMSIIHRDVSPTNVFVTRSGHIKLVDFGLAKYVGTERTQTGVIKGKLAYLSPEQARGEPLDRRTDLFSLGLVLYSLLALDSPYSSVAEHELVATLASLQRPPPPPPGTPDGLVSILGRLLEPDREKRYATATEVIDELEAFLDAGLRPREEDLARFVEARLPDSKTRRPTALSSNAVAVSGGMSEVTRILQPAEIADLLAVAEQTVPDIPAPRPRSRRLFGVVAAASLTLLAMVVLWASHRSSPPTRVHEVSPPERPAPLPSPLPPNEPEPSPTPPVESTTHDTSPRPRARGRATIISTPVTDIHHHGQRLGRSPVTTPGLPSGPQQFRLVNPDLGINKVVSLTIVGGRTTERRFTLQRGRVAFHIEPWAVVTIDGKRAGETPMPPVELYEGRHRVKLENPKTGRDKTLTVTVQPNQTVTVNEQLF